MRIRRPRIRGLLILFSVIFCGDDHENVIRSRAAANSVIFIALALMWGINGWAQSMGAPPSIVSLSRWFPLRIRGTYYGFFSAFHNINWRRKQ